MFPFEVNNQPNLFCHYFVKFDGDKCIFSNADIILSYPILEGIEILKRNDIGLNRTKEDFITSKTLIVKQNFDSYDLLSMENFVKEKRDTMRNMKSGSIVRMYNDIKDYEFISHVYLYEVRHAKGTVVFNKKMFLFKRGENYFIFDKVHLLGIKVEGTKISENSFKRFSEYFTVEDGYKYKTIYSKAFPFYTSNTKCFVNFTQLDSMEFFVGKRNINFVLSFNKME